MAESDPVLDAALDPGLARLAEIGAAKGLPPLTELDPAEARERVRGGDKLCADGPDLHSVTDTTLRVNARSVAVRVYRPAAQSTGRTLVYAHGGGWVTGDLDYADEFCRFVARDVACTVISVDYRLAPEHRHPAALDDVETALRWAAENETGLLAIAGDSAGGNLAAACAIRGRDSGGRQPAFQVLLYPVLDHDFSRPSYVSRAAAFPIGVDDMTWFFDHYVPDVARRDDPTVSPLRSADVSGLPPTLVVVAGHDPLHDEGVAYAERIRQAGVPVTLQENPSLSHGFLRFTAVSPAAEAARASIVTAIDGLFAEYDPSGGPRGLPEGEKLCL